MLGVVGLLVAMLPAQPPATDDPDLRSAVERFYEAQEKEDIAAYLALWSAHAQRPAPGQLKYIFETGDDRFSDIRITRASPAGSQMRVRVEVQRERTTPPRVAGDPPVVTTSLMRVALTFEKEGAGWKLIREGPAADDLAAALVEAGTDDQRAALMDADPELFGSQLLTALARLGGAAAVSQNYRRAQAIYEILVTAARRGGFEKEEGEGLQNVANALYFQRRFPEALTAYEQRLVLERRRGDDAGVGAALAGIATIRYSLAEYTEALARYREALAIQERLDDVAGIAQTMLSIGNITYLQGEFTGAIRAYRRSLDLSKTMFHADGESRALEGLGRVYMSQGDYLAALEVFDTVLKDPRMSSVRGRLGAVAQSLAEVHFRLGNLDTAKAAYEQSRAHFESVRDMSNVGRVLQGVALTDLVAGRFGSAEDAYTRSGTICAAADDQVCRAAATAGLAYAQAAQEKFDHAATSYRKAIAEFDALERREDVARCQVGLSQALLGSADAAGAIEAATNARRDAIALEADDVLWRALTAEARAIRRLGDRVRALGVARAAMGVLDRLEAIANDKPGSSLTKEAAAAMATFAVLQAETGDPSGAFATSERLRAVEIRAAIAGNERDISRGMTDEERAEERALASQLLTRLAQQSREKGLPKPDAARLTELQKLVAEATDARRSWMQQLFERHPDLRDLRGLGRPKEIADADALLRGSDEVLLSLVLDEDDLLVFTVTRAETTDAQSSGRGPAITADVAAVARRQVAELVVALQQPAALEDSATWVRAAAAIVAILPERARARLSSSSRIVVLPHGVLWRVPFDSLLSATQGSFKDHASITVAGSLESAIRSSARHTAGARSVVGIASPLIGPERLERIRQGAPGWSPRSVENTESEVRAAAAAYPAAGATILTGASATERAVRDGLGASVIHIGAPFRMNAASPLFSTIVLSPPSAPASAPARPPSVADAADDGSLELREVFNLDVPARVVLFSDGAATAMRDGAAATDVLQWGWLAAGVPTVLVARWAAPAGSTERVLAEFHRQIAGGAEPSAALRTAQRLVRSEPATAAPVHWAGWMLFGAR
jgi:tetratricopeptide (TPR) repeat protein